MSNPPYIAAAEHPTLPPEVAAHEPYGALVSGETGLEHLEHLIAEAPGWLEPGGALVRGLRRGRGARRPHRAPPRRRRPPPLMVQGTDAVTAPYVWSH